MKYENKNVSIEKETGKSEEHDFMFPNVPNSPMTIRAKSREEAEEKFNKIINNKE